MLEHRRTGKFLPGGAVNNLPKKFSHVAQIFTKQSKRNEGPITMHQHRATCVVKIFLHMNLSYELMKHVNSSLCRLTAAEHINDTIHVIVDYRVLYTFQC